MLLSVADCVAAWITAYEEEAGECGNILYGIIDAVNPVKDPDWIHLRHQEFDGVGGFGHLTGIQKLPKIREKQPLSPKEIAWSCLSLLLRPNRPSLRWAEHQSTGLSRPLRPIACAWELLSSEDTLRAASNAKAAGVTLNTWMLHNLGQVLRPNLTGNPNDGMAWIVPVNLRGYVQHADPHSNHSSFLDPQIFDSDSPEDLQQRIDDLRRRGRHCGIWHLMTAGRWLGNGMIRALARTDTARGQARVGVFSNLGAWEAIGGKSTRHWLFCSPCFITTPFAAGAVTWEGRLGLVIQIHPSLALYREKVSRWMSDWINQIVIFNK